MTKEAGSDSKLLCLIRPLLNYASDKKGGPVGDEIDPLINELGLTEGEEPKLLQKPCI